MLEENYAPPGEALARRGLLDRTKGFSIYDPLCAQKMIEAVAGGKVDVAILWGPLAGYYVRHSRVPLEMVEVSPNHEGPFPFEYSIAMAVRPGDTATRARLENAMRASKPEIERILTEFAVPQPAMRGPASNVRRRAGD